ncbi:MAG TPA: IPT/TIG domain-containing protein [Candidatus Methylomirabilis sp.]|nr:IPT/TIG domain-containing protein [Candidatus Methylomirabilis sp.]
MSKAKKIILSGITTLAALTVAHFAWALDVGTNFGATLGLPSADPRLIASRIIQIALGFLGIIAIGLIIYGGFLWMTAAGNEDRVDTAKRVLISAVIGLIIILSAFGIATFVLNNLLQAVGGGSDVGGPCSSSATACVPSNSLCRTGLTCGANCFCFGGIIPPNPPGPGENCDGNPLTPVCEPGNCQAGSFCDTTSCTCKTGGNGAPCDGDLAAAGCQIDKTKCASGFFCSAADNCTCRQQGGDGSPCDGDLNTSGCQILGAMCADNFFCDPDSNCTCKSGSGVGQKCNSSADPAVCQPDQTVCADDLTCDASAGATACTCQEFPKINWISPVGGFCANDQNKICKGDADCPSSTCDKTTANAAPGNIISIGGEFFGATRGNVFFPDAAGNYSLSGGDPAKLNPNCNSSWSDNQIIVVVPAGAKSGPVKIERADTKRTNDPTDPAAQLTINNISKPGLCKVANGEGKAEGKYNDTLGYYGLNLANATAEFGNYDQSLAGKNSVFAALNGTADVPNIQAGETTTFAANAAGTPSNYLAFTKNVEPKTGPFIISFEPAAGAPGQYVTIRGSGFGAARAASDVSFVSAANSFRADYSFPDICATSVWSDKQIIVKVPANIDNGNYVLNITIGGQTISTAALSPNTFKVDSSLNLIPSLCRINPVIGETGTPMTLWGEYFDDFNAATSKVRFFNNQDVAGADKLVWAIDNTAAGANKPYKIQTTVPAAAQTGPVRVVKGSPELAGNGLNFQIGSCLDAADPNAACGSQQCCPTGTAKAGRCVDNAATGCAVDIPSSVYEFDFTTNVTPVGPGQVFTSCEEKSKLLGTCSSDVCPNSPGLCSLFGGGTPTAVADCVFSCDGVGKCANGSCAYNASIDKCTDKNISSCSLAETVKGADGKDVAASCAEYKGAPHFVFALGKNISCPAGWTKDNLGAGNSLILSCIDTNSSCSLCDAGFACADNGLQQGVCAAAADICPTGSTCQPDNKCEKTAEASCSCCCRKANVNEDCCAGLTCDGTCGSDAGAGPDTGTFGSCSGCTRHKADGSVDIAASDAACNCVGKTSGDYCETGDDNGKGVCKSCAQLSGASSCSAHGNSCCVDLKENGDCRGIGNGDVMPTGPGGTAYCAYYQCDSASGSCGQVPKPDTNYFSTAAECGAKCSVISSPLGKSCQNQRQSTSCNLGICSPFTCLLESGQTAPASGSDCGFCCCDPGKTGTDNTNLNTYDTCHDLGANVACRANQTPCSGGQRGLCCGCSANTDCVPSGVTPEGQGCGSDSCCRARPNVATTAPADGASGICTNSTLTATFDQRMNVASFANNVVVAGEYPPGTHCPEGTGPLSGLPDKNNLASQIFANVYNWVAKPVSWLFGRFGLASAPPNFSHAYCAIVGTVSGEQSGDSATILRFSPHSLLDASRKYYFIIKGDTNLDNSQGVANFWGIGMNAQISPVDNTVPFGGVSYPRSYVWSFTTLADTVGNKKGACGIDHVTVTPNSYLFQSVTNDLNENDSDSNSKSFDTVADSDKVFLAQALSKDNQALNPVAEYSWNWNWSVADNKVAGLVNPGPFAPTDQAQLVRAAADITGDQDKKTKLTAQVNLLSSGLLSAGDKATGTAAIFVFVCANPWPAVQADGTWRPWLDTLDATNCVAGSGACNKMNYELYYCRDQGTNAPLPAINDTATRGLQNNILKETFFFKP